MPPYHGALYRCFYHRQISTTDVSRRGGHTIYTAGTADTPAHGYRVYCRVNWVIRHTLAMTFRFLGSLVDVSSHAHVSILVVSFLFSTALKKCYDEI